MTSRVAVRRLLHDAPLFVALLIVGLALWPMTQVGLWSDDWGWFDQLNTGGLNLGGPYYNFTSHANPLPLEVQWYRIHFALFGDNAFAHHALDLAGHLLTLTLLYALIRRLGGNRWAGAAAVLLAGLAPAPINAFTWVSASPHMWATLFALGSILCYLAWRRPGGWPWLVASLLLAVAAVWSKNDGVLAPVFVILYETVTRLRRHPRSAATVIAAYAFVGALFLWWQATAHDPIRDAANPTVGGILRNAVDLLTFVVMPDSTSVLRAQFSTGRRDLGDLAAAAAVGAAVVVVVLVLLSLRTTNGRVLIAAGLLTSLPVLALDAAIVSRYAYPLTLSIAAAAALGLLTLRRVRVPALPRSVVPALAAAAVLVTACVWGTLAHAKASSGAASSNEGDALLAAIAAVDPDLSRGGSLELIGSPLDANTAHFRFMDPRLPPRLHSSGVWVGTDQTPRLRVMRQPDGTYVVIP